MTSSLATMRAVRLSTPGPVGNLQLTTLPIPPERDGWVRIRVEAFGLNRCPRSSPSTPTCPVVFDTLAGVTNTPEFRGYAFLNVAAEYADPDHPVRQVIATHRRWFRSMLRDLLSDSGHPDPETTADLPHTLRDGLLTAGCLDEPHALHATAQDGLRRLIDLSV